MRPLLHQIVSLRQFYPETETSKPESIQTSKPTILPHQHLSLCLQLQEEWISISKQNQFVKITAEKMFSLEIFGQQEPKLLQLLTKMLQLKCSKKSMTESQKEVIDGTA